MKKEIVKQFFEKGILLSPQALRGIEDGTVQDSELKRMLAGGGPFMGDPGTEEPKAEHAKKPVQKAGTNVKVSDHRPMKTMKAADFIYYFTTRYEHMKALLQKLPAVSINNAKKLGKATIIGMAKNPRGSGLFIEDPTGEIEAVLPGGHDIKDGDVLGFSGLIRAGKMVVQKVVYPDIPLNRSHPKLVGGVVIKVGETITLHSGKEMAEINCDLPQTAAICNKLRMLFFSPGELTEEQATALLKKRHLSPPMDRLSTREDIYTLDPIPDILFLVTGSEWSRIYKGVSVISARRGSTVKIDLKGMRVEFVNMQASPRNKHAKAEEVPGIQ